MDFFDAHCHLQDKRLMAQLEAVLARSSQAGITRYLLGGTDPDDWKRQQELQKNLPARIFMSFGIHPWRAAGLDALAAQKTINALEEALTAHGRDVSAIGETGIDKGPRMTNNSLKMQTLLFERQLAIARTAAKPVVLHVVRAHEEVLAALKNARLSAGGLVHAFASNHDTAKKYMDLGFYLSFGAASGQRSTAALVPHDRVVLESDAPDMLPRGHTTPSGLNEPSSVRLAAQALTTTLNLPEDHILALSTRNIEQLLKSGAAAQAMPQ